MADKDGPDGIGGVQRSHEPGGRVNPNVLLSGSIEAVSQLPVENLGLTEMLTQVATLAVTAIPGADGAGLTLLEVDRADLIVKSEAFVRAIDNIQYSIGEGPCISAAATGRTKRSGQLRDDPRWPQFGPRASDFGVHSALSLPLVVTTGILGAMNVYARAPDAFDDYAQWCGETFAVSASLAVQNAQILNQTARFVDQLRDGLERRGVIDQAVGVLRRRDGDSADKALCRLKELALAQQVSLTAAAVQVLENAIRGGRRSDAEAPSD